VRLNRRRFAFDLDLLDSLHHCRALVAIAAVYLLRTNPKSGLWAQGYDPTGHWWISTIFALCRFSSCLAQWPFAAEGTRCGGRRPHHALLVAIAIFHMPAGWHSPPRSMAPAMESFHLLDYFPVIFLYSSRSDGEIRVAAAKPGQHYG